MILARLPAEFVTLTVPACPNGCCPARRLRVGINGYHGRSVRLAFDCPPDVTVLRDELLPPRVAIRGDPPSLKPGVRR